tara:strand:+ start:400 stop:600 length:201 start_codon:yes stop_codon:yes gene_type:complete
MYGVIVRVGDAQTIPCDILNCGWLEGVIIVALLLTTPVLCDCGDATVVFAKTLTGQRITAIAQTYL